MARRHGVRLDYSALTNRLNHQGNNLGAARSYFSIRASTVLERTVRFLRTRGSFRRVITGSHAKACEC